MRFAGKIAVVTGAASGIGKEAAVALAKEGCRVFCFDIKEKAGLQLINEIEEKGYKGAFFTVDLTDEREVCAAVKSVIKEGGKIDILVHSAGITSKIKFLDLSLDSWKKTIDVNLTGSFLITYEVGKIMVKQNYGRIVIISSGSAVTGTGGGPHYAASKAGQIGLTRALANELAQFGITVNAIGPRNIETPLLNNLYDDGGKAELLKKIPLGRLGTPKNVADLVLFLASDESSYITGQFIIIDGGRTFS